MAKKKRTSKKQKASPFGCLTIFVCAVIIWIAGANSDETAEPSASSDNSPRTVAQQSASEIVIVVTPAAPTNQKRLQPTTEGEKDSAILLSAANGISIELEHFEFRSLAGSSREPSRDAWLILYGTLTNDTSSELCIYSGDISLLQDGDERGPRAGAMEDIKSTLSPERNYVGAYNGQCVAGNSSDLTFLVFDVTLEDENISFIFDDSEVPLVVDFPTSADEIDGFVSVPVVNAEVAQASTEMQSTSIKQENDTEEEATNTITNTPPPTETLTSTPIPLTTLYITGNTANARECPELNCDVVIVLGRGDEISGVEQVEGAQTSGSSQWWKALYDGQEIYVHSSLVSRNRPVINAAPPSQQPQQPAGQAGGQAISPATEVLISTPPPAPASYACDCSKTCTVMTCEEAYFQLVQCGCTDRDSDRDGKPCETQCGG